MTSKKDHYTPSGWEDHLQTLRAQGEGTYYDRWDVCENKYQNPVDASTSWQQFPALDFNQITVPPYTAEERAAHQEGLDAGLAARPPNPDWPWWFTTAPDFTEAGPLEAT